MIDSLQWSMESISRGEVVVDPWYSTRSTSILGSVCLLSCPRFNVDTGVDLNDMHWAPEVVCTNTHKTRAALLDNTLRHRNYTGLDLTSSYRHYCGVDLRRRTPRRTPRQGPEHTGKHCKRSLRVTVTLTFEQASDFPVSNIDAFLYFKPESV